ncbi:MAG: hypothetical protein ACTSU2_02495, partial [Promethearchaeota archaeon]
DYTKLYPNAKNDGVVWDTPYQNENMTGSDNFPLVYPPDYNSKLKYITITIIIGISLGAIAITFYIIRKKRRTLNSNNNNGNIN